MISYLLLIAFRMLHHLWSRFWISTTETDRNIVLAVEIVYISRTESIPMVIEAITGRLVSHYLIWSDAIKVKIGSGYPGEIKTKIDTVQLLICFCYPVLTVESGIGDFFGLICVSWLRSSRSSRKILNQIVSFHLQIITNWKIHCVVLWVFASEWMVLWFYDSNLPPLQPFYDSDDRLPTWACDHLHTTKKRRF